MIYILQQDVHLPVEDNVWSKNRHSCWIGRVQSKKTNQDQNSPCLVKPAVLSRASTPAFVGSSKSVEMMIRLPFFRQVGESTNHLQDSLLTMCGA